VLQYLLLERVPIRNLRNHLRDAGGARPRTRIRWRWSPPCALLSAAASVQNIGGLRQELPVITLDPALEQVLQDLDGRRRRRIARVRTRNLPTEFRQRLPTARAAKKRRANPRYCWLHENQAVDREVMRHSTPSLAVLAYNEIPENAASE